MSRDLVSGDYLDCGVAANCAQQRNMTIAALVKVDAITGANQTIVSRVTDAGTNGWELMVQATSGNLLYRLAESDDSTGTSRTQATAGAWLGLAAIVYGADGAGGVRYLRYHAETGLLDVEVDSSFFNAPSASGTHKCVIGGAWNGGLVKPFAGLVARVGIWPGLSLSETDLLFWFRYQGTPDGGAGLWTLAGTASPEPDASGNGYDGTLSGTSQGEDPPIITRHLPIYTEYPKAMLRRTA